MPTPKYEDAVIYRFEITQAELNEYIQALSIIEIDDAIQDLLRPDYRKTVAELNSRLLALRKGGG